MVSLVVGGTLTVLLSFVSGARRGKCQKFVIINNENSLYVQTE